MGDVQWNKFFAGYAKNGGKTGKKGLSFVKSLFFKGMAHGIPICLGYLSVSFGFGIMTVKAGLTVWEAVLISASNLTSAGQAAGVGIIAAAGGYLEMIMTQLVINVRYSLMGISLSQKLAPSFKTPQRLIASFGITDEIFVVSSAQKTVYPAYMYGLILISFVGWVSGTFLGAAAGQILPAALTDAMGIVLYGMFVAIVIPEAKKEKSILVVAILAALFSVLFYYVFTAVSSGFAIIISTIAASVLGAVLFPVKAEEEEGQE